MCVLGGGGGGWHLTLPFIMVSEDFFHNTCSYTVIHGLDWQDL